MRWVVRAVAAFFKPKASLVAENLCLRQQILVLQRRHPRGFVKLTDCRQFSIFLHEAKPLKLHIAAISDLPIFRRESG